MVDIYLYGTNYDYDLIYSKQVRQMVRELFSSLSNEDATLVMVESTAFMLISDAPTPFIRIEGFADMDNKDLIVMGNHFVASIDVSISNGRGVRVKNKKGEAFGQYCLQPLGFVPPVTQIGLSGPYRTDKAREPYTEHDL